MTLYEISIEYRKEADALRQRIRELRAARKTCPEPQRFYLDRRIADLTAIQRETRALALHLEHYYERGYSRNGKYTL